MITKEEFLNGTAFRYKDDVYHFHDDRLYELIGIEWHYIARVQITDKSLAWWRFVVDKRISGEILFKDCAISSLS